MRNDYYRKNFILNLLGEGIRGLSAGFITPITILTIFVSQFTSSKIFIGLLFTIPALGNFAGPILSAYLGAGLKRKKTLLVNLHILYVLCWFAISVFAFISSRFTPSGNLIAFFIIYGLSGFLAGIIIPQWFDYIAKILGKKIGTYLGLAFALSGGFSIVGALWAKQVLERVPSPDNFGFCFLFAGLIQLSFPVFIFFQIEKEDFPLSGRAEFRTYLHNLFKILKEDKNYIHILIVQILLSFGAMSSSFYAVYAGSKFEMTGNVVGSFTVMLIIGGMVGSIFLGAMGDVIGHSFSLSIAIVGGIGAALCALLANSLTLFYILFFLLGIFLIPTFISCTNLVLEMATIEHRPSYIALNSMIVSPFAAIAPILGGIFINAFSYSFVFILTIIVLFPTLIIIKKKGTGYFFIAGL